jgi:hypothetical protein
VASVLSITIAIVSLSGLLPAKDVRPYSGQNLSQRWHASTDDSYVNFRRGPDHYVEIVECLVVRSRECNQGVQTQDTDDGNTAGHVSNKSVDIACPPAKCNSQRAHEKHQSNSDFLLPMKLQPLQLRQR